MLVTMYFGPTIIAGIRKHRQLAAIGAVNLLLGWTVIGWIAAFVWSLVSPTQPQTIVVQSPPPPSSSA